MNLARVSFLIIAATTFGLIALAYLPTNYIILRGFADLEERSLRQNTTRAVNALMGEVREVNSLALNLAAWDDMYAFVREGDHSRVASRLTITSFAEQDLNLVAVLTAEGSLAFERTYNLAATGQETPLPSQLQRELPYLVDTLAHCGSGDCSVSGLLRLSDGVMLVAARPILTSDGQGPPAGVFLYGRYLRQDIEDQLEKDTCLDLDFLDPDNSSLPPMTDPQGLNLVRRGMEQIVSHTVVRDIHGRTALVLRVVMGREIYAQGSVMSLYTLVVLMAAGLVFGWIAIVLVRRRVLSRVASLSAQVARIGESGDVSRRVAFRGSDELALLSKLINEMLSELERSRTTLDTQYRDLQDNERFLHQLFDSLQVGLLLVDPATRQVVDANARARHLVGKDGQEILGALHSGLFRMPGGRPVPLPEPGREVGLFECSLVLGDSTSLPVLQALALLERQGEPFMLATFIDISERHAAQEALRISEQAYRAIFMNSGAATLIADEDGLVLLANQEFASISGLSRQQVEGIKDWREFLHPDDAMRFGDWRRLVNERGRTPQRSQCRFITAPGEERFVTLSVAPIPGAGQGVISILDITDRRRAEQALLAAHDDLEIKVADRTRKLEQANKALMEMDQVRSSFLSSASHELRTPLTSVLGFAKLMNRNFRRLFMPLAEGDEKLERRAAEFSNNFEIIEKEGERLTRLINDLLDLNKIESGRLDWRDAELYTNAVLDRAAASVAGLVSAKPGLRLELDVPEDLPPVFVDPDRIQQVLINLLNNAVKFTEAGRVTLGAAADDHGLLKVWVSDTGMGILPGELERIFDKFYQSQREVRDQAKIVGTGLGLAICRQIVEHYGGVIWAESAPGKGSTFTFTLPLSGV